MTEHNDPPTCATCRHFADHWGNMCEHPDVMTFEPVHGRTPMLASTARSVSACGPSGALWEGREYIYATRWPAICLATLIIAYMLWMLFR